VRGGDRRRWVLEVARRADDGPESAWQQRARDPEVWKDPAALAELARAGPLDARFVPLQLTLARHIVTHKGEGGVGLLRRVQAAHPNDFWAAFWLGEVLAARSDPDAVGYVRAALAIRPEGIVAHLVLGYLLGAEGRLGEAAEQYGRALELDPASDLAHYDLARCLWFQGLPDRAGDHCREANRLNPRWGPPHVLLGQALLDLGRFDEAHAALRRSLELLPAETKMAGLAQQALQRCDRLQALEGRLSGIVRGTDRPAGAAEEIDLAELCARTRRAATAARLYAHAFAAEPGLAEIPGSHRYQSARAAARAGCGEGEDDAPLDDPTRAGLRRQALAWLRADRDVLAVQYTRANSEYRKSVVWLLRLWLHDAAFAGVRDKEGLARLGDGERRQWQAFWTVQEGIAAGDMIPTLGSARASATRREWELAAEGYLFFKLMPTDDGHAWFEFAAVQLLSGDREGYRQTCARLAGRFPGTAGVRPYHVARACTLAPDAVADIAKPAQLSADELRRSSAAHWSLTEQAALLHRAGRSREAVPLLERSLAAEAKRGAQVVNWLWLSLAHQRLGRADEARRWLDKAGRWLDQFGGGMPANAGALGLDLHNWLEAHALRREAEELLRPSPARK
jgi:tetratricopeptide (TPR) repeat protein